MPTARLVMRIAFAILLSTLVAACQSLSRDDAKALATAGQAAAQSLQDQAGAVEASLQNLPATIALTEIMKCEAVKPALRPDCIRDAPANAQPTAFEVARKQLVDISARRAKAMGELEAAYKSFGDLASYDAGQATANAIGSAFATINTRCPHRLPAWALPVRALARSRRRLPKLSVARRHSSPASDNRN